MKRKIYVLVCLLLASATVFNLSSSFITVNREASEVVTKTVMIDAGHGGEDGGAVGINSIFEKDINLPIALLLKDLFIKGGYRVIMTRCEDIDLGDKRLTSVGERKRSDMKKRAELTANSGADILLSIHQNHFEENKYHGAQMFYASENSKKLAEVLQRTIVEEVQPENTRLAKKTDSVFLLNRATMPAVIVECGFISNKEEAALLSSSEHREKIAMAIYNASCKYLSVL